MHTASERISGSGIAVLLLALSFSASSQVLADGSATTATEARLVRVMDFSTLTAPVTVVFRYTALEPQAAGQAEIDPSRIGLKIHGTFSKLSPAPRLGPEYLTYVLWAVSPEGRAVNLGEITLAGDEGRISAKMAAGRFGLLVTAEPYFAVSRPAKAVILEADLAPGGSPSVTISRANCELLNEPVGSDAFDPSPGAATDPAALVIEEARRAIVVAQKSGAQQYAPETLATAQHLLQIARDGQAHGVPRKDVTDAGSEAVLIAEDARVLAVKRQMRRGEERTKSGPSH